MGNNSHLYDLNGNETMNLSHGMAYARYNNRNLPDSVVFLYGNSLTMRYTADASKPHQTSLKPSAATILSDVAKETNPSQNVVKVVKY